MTEPETTSLALDYAVPQPRRYDRRMAALHAPMFFGSMAVALYMLASLRGWGPGSAMPALFLINTFIMLPAVVILPLGMPLRRYLIALVLLLVIPPAMADAYGTFEEWLFVRQARQLPPTAPSVYKARWWPAENCYLYYEPSTGYFGGGD